MTEKRRAAPSRRRGETKATARKRWKSAGLCQNCGAKKSTSGPLCSKCLGRRKGSKGRWRDK